MKLSLRVQTDPAKPIDSTLFCHVMTPPTTYYHSLYPDVFGHVPYDSSPPAPSTNRETLPFYINRCEGAQSPLLAMESITLQHLSLHLKKTKDDRPYLLVTQTAENGKTRKVCWFPEDWKAIGKAMDQSRPRTVIPIRARRNLKVNIDSQTVYIATQTLDENGIVFKWFYIVLSAEDWNRLIQLRQMVDNMLTEEPKREAGASDSSPPQKRLKLDIPAPATLTQYKWRYTWRNHEAREGDEWFFDELECREDAPRDVPDYTVVTRQIPRPSSDQMAAWVYRYLLRQELKRHMMNNCEGCAVDHPSQTQHMQRGCLSEWHEGLDMIDAVLHLVTAQRVILKCQMVWDALDQSVDKPTVDPANLSLDNLYVPAEYLRIFDKPATLIYRRHSC